MEEDTEHMMKEKDIRNDQAVGAWVARSVKRLPSAQVMIKSWILNKMSH